MQTEVITNDPDIQAYVPEGFLFTLIEEEPRKVYETARDRIHLGAKLLAHPMTGQLRPHETPFRTAVLALAPADDPRPVDLTSLEIIEYCLAEEDKYAPMRKKFFDGVMPELSFISAVLFKEVIKQLEQS